MIASIEHYNNGLLKSLKDKLFFTDKITSERFIDFGCGGGALLNELKKLNPNSECIGYDTNPDMVTFAQNNNDEHIITNKWDEIQNIVNKHHKKTTIILSSVIHEVYSYCTEDEINLFWTRVFNSGFDNIVVRDMMLSQTITHAHNYPIKKIKKNFDPIKIKQWEKKWGTLDEHKSLMHFLLTYQYDDNWARECDENYFPLSIEQLVNKIPVDHSIIFKKHFTLPYIKKSVKNDFDIELKTKTHGKIIITKNI